MAFEQAESRPDEMISANRMAEEALLRSDLLCGEEIIPEVDDGLGDAADDDDFSVDRAPAFRTETMAALLEQQGDASRARAIREELVRGRPPVAGPEPGAGPGAQRSAGGAGRRPRILATLETWLGNIQRRSP
jgi:hypothetical protein